MRVLETGARASRAQADAVGEMPPSRDPVDAAFLAAAADAGIHVAAARIGSDAAHDSVLKRAAIDGVVSS